MARKKQNELLRVYIQGDEVHILQKSKLDKKEVLILAGICADFLKMISNRPTKGKQWQN